MIFSGNSNRKLVEAIAAYLNTAPGKANVGRFSDGETNVEIGENVRGKNCFVVQSTCNPVNHHIMELLVIMDALRRSSAGQIIAMIPYYGYGRQDRKVAPRTPITSKLVADMLTAAGADRVVSIDLHAGQIQGFFNIPFDHLFAAPVFLEDIRQRFERPPVIVSPDAGGTERARAYSKRLRSTLAIIDKRRSAPNVSEVMNVIGEVEGQEALLVDDMVDTAGTLTLGAQVLLDRGATRVVAYAVHPVLSGPAMERIESSPLDELVVTDTVPLNERANACKKIRVLSVAPLLGEAIRRIHMQDSVSALFV
ncbi:MAG: phosphoribosylpyrophosphate synthetase [Deltaproteobacteria bacterium]|nr:MAG: phosphoribosylpyrophosphate synthetase [Deltaproteobacteria bacterium]